MNKNTNPVRGLVLIICLLLLVFFASSIFRDATSRTDYSYADIRSLFEAKQVETVKVDDHNTLTLTLKEPKDGNKVITYSLYNFDLFYQDFNDIVVQQYRDGVISDYEYPDSPSPAWMSTILTWVVVLGIMALLWYFLFLRKMQGGGGPSASQFGKAKARTLAESGRSVTFDDVAGADEEKEELSEVVDFLRQPAQFTQLGARIPKGILLVGPPGTGKTLLARAVAGEAGCQYLSISGSDFVELYVGVGASRVRDLFEQAKKSAPAIVFIDEIDAVGRQRGTGLGGGHDEREQTLNQLLVEMDGFASNEGVIVLAATNRADILDPALLRPGRFDRQIYVGLPDIKGREEILRVHARNKPLAEDVDLHTVAQATVGFTGADLENLLNEAALLSARQGRPFIRMDTLHEAMLKVIAGPEKKSRVVPPLAKKLTAYHEAGHAVVIHELETQDPVHQITIIPRGPAGGMTISLPEEDRMYQSRRELQERICTCLGGRVAEELVLGDISTGASNDLQTATAIARSMVMKYGMSDRLGAISYDSDQEVFIGRSMTQSRSYSEEVAGLIDEEIKAILDAAYARCKEILSQNMDALERTAQYLLEFETMSAEDFTLVFGPPEALEQRKEEIRIKRSKEAEEKAQEQARLQAEREAEAARRLQEAEEQQTQEAKRNDNPPDPF
ncbi:MAG: ATP-dependent zinc metalloprotease FtsH [Evtepia sp.]|uniref:ATP-dependent zinc metalloprotease FtsH n=1 Tax=Evtepia sp. TaxID=2773933 RepID=UPI002A762E3A|nr:ATP-dependent zinc metalloprotease FtsH [Evtepia sp.]MDY3015272.1 ATP-dependent zinc metalloprotease FtsH [Evtepia sp.]